MKRSKLNRLKFRDLREVIRGFAVFLVVAVVFALPLMVPPKVGAATQAQINAALESGVAWSAAQQQAAGYWLIAPGYSETDQRRTLGTTGLALAVLGHYAEHLGKTPLSPDYAYHEHMQKGLNYIFGKAYRNAVDNRVWFGNASITSADNYSAGPILMGIVMSGDPDLVVDVPGSNVDGMTYGQVVQEIVNYLAYTQCTAGNGIGAWYYNGLSTTGDLSITGFVTLGLGYARDRFNTVVVVQPNMLTQLNQGIAFMQWTSDNPADPSYSMVGGAGYSSGSGTTGYENWINIYKVGHLLYIMDLVGDSAGEARVLRSLGFLARHWNAPNSGESGYDIGTGEWNTKVNDYWDVGWRGGPPSSPPDPLPSYIAMMATMKGLVALGVLYVGDQDWFADFSDVIVANQDVNGSWRQGGYPDHYSSTLDSQFALLTLLRAAQEDPVVDPDVENNIKRPKEPDTPDYEVTGTVTLEVTGNVKFAIAKRGNIGWDIGARPRSDRVTLPVGGYEFTLKNVPVGGQVVMKIIPPPEALDPNNDKGFLNPDGTIKAGLNWFKLEGSTWEGTNIPIKLMPEGGPPYTHLEVTLTDGGPEDKDARPGWIGDPGAPGVGADEGVEAAGGSTSHCFIATAAYGSPLAEDVTVLRNFRDRFLLTNPAGKAFVKMYYAVSPPIARFIAGHDALRAAVRVALAPVVFSVKHPSALLAGILFGGIFLLGGFYRRRHEG